MKHKPPLSVQILIGLLLGVLAGLALQAAPDVARTYIKPFGVLFLNLIKMVVVPLVFASITAGTCGLGDAKKVGRIGGKTILFYLCTTALAVTLGLLAANLFPVGRGLGQVAQESAGAAGTTVSVADTLLNIVPTNPVAALAEGNMLQIIFFALCLGGAILLIGEKGLPLLAVCDSLAEAMYALTGFIMKLAPVAVFALIAPVVAELGPRVLLAFLGVILVVYGACLLHMLVGYSIAVGGIARVNPLTFFRTALPALVFAFSSASSAGTLPFSMEAARRLGVPLRAPPGCHPQHGRHRHLPGGVRPLYRQRLWHPSGPGAAGHHRTHLHAGLRRHRRGPRRGSGDAHHGTPVGGTARGGGGPGGRHRPRPGHGPHHRQHHRRHRLLGRGGRHRNRSAHKKQGD